MATKSLKFVMINVGIHGTEVMHLFGAHICDFLGLLLFELFKEIE